MMRQRERLDERIRLLAEKRDALASQPTKPSGWHWVSTGEMFGPWWAEQTEEARNAWLRSAGVRVEFDLKQIRVEFGDLETMLRELSAGNRAKQWQETFVKMKQTDIAGMELRPGEVIFHRTDGLTETFTHTRGVFEDQVNTFPPHGE